MPPSGPGNAHTPFVQGRPLQQSPFVVHLLPCWTQPAPQMNGGGPFGFGTQGRPQQSALDEQALLTSEPPSGLTPASRHCPAPVQRGIPLRSCWQTSGFWLTLPAQQLFSALQLDVASLQIAPAGRHAVPLSQRPAEASGVPLAQVTLPLPPPLLFAEPQQSSSIEQISPVGLQPLGGWQISTLG